MNKQGIIFVGIGFELVGLILAAVYIGQAIDRYMGWTGIAMAALMMISLAGWITHIVILLNRQEKQENEHQDP